MTATARTGRPGRRRGGSDTRETLLDAAREAFAERGYEKATVRDIAGRAGVDPAMINHYFGSKEKLLLAVVDMPVDPIDALASETPVRPERLGEHLVRALVGAWDRAPGDVGLALVRSAGSSPVAAGMLRDFVLARVLGPVVEQVETDPRRVAWRTSLVATQLAGLILVRYVIRAEPIASASAEAVVAAVSGQVQHYLTGDVGGV